MDPETVATANPYGLTALWAQGDFVAKGTLILLVLMSAYSWFIIFTKWWEQRRLLRQAREVEKSFWSAENIKAGVSKLSGKGNIFKGIASEAIDAAEHHDERLTQQVPLHEWIDNVHGPRGRPDQQWRSARSCPSSRRPDRRRRSSACSARCGASITRS